MLDYYGFAKAGYYYVRRAYAPVMASFKALEDGNVELWITNNTLHEIDDVVTVRLRTFAGAVVWEESFRAHVAANTSRPVGRWEKGELRGGTDRYLSVRSANGVFGFNRHFFAAVKDLQRTPVRPEVTITSAGDHELRVRLRSTEYAYFVHLSVPDESTHFEDNYFDLEPGECRTIDVTNTRIILAPNILRISWR